MQPLAVYEERDRAIDGIVAAPAGERFDAIRQCSVPGDREAWILYGDACVYWLAGNANAALTSVRESLRHDADSPLAWALYSSLMGGPESLPDLRIIVERFPTLWRPRLSLGQALRSDGVDPRETASYCRTLTAERPDSLAAQMGLCAASIRLRDRAGAAEAARYMVAVGAGSPDGFSTFAVLLLFRAGLIAEAFRIARADARRTPTWRNRLLPWTLPVSSVFVVSRPRWLVAVVAAEVATLLIAFNGHVWALGLFAAEFVYLSLGQAAIRPLSSASLAPLRERMAKEPPLTPGFLRDGATGTAALTGGPKRTGDPERAAKRVRVLAFVVPVLVVAAVAGLTLVRAPASPYAHPEGTALVVAYARGSESCSRWRFDPGDLVVSGQEGVVARPPASVQGSGAGCVARARAVVPLEGAYTVTFGTLRAEVIKLRGGPRACSQRYLDNGDIGPKGIHVVLTVLGPGADPVRCGASAGN